MQKHKKLNLNPSASSVQMCFVNLAQLSKSNISFSTRRPFKCYLGSPAEVRVDMYVANIWAMEEVKMVRVSHCVLN